MLPFNLHAIICTRGKYWVNASKSEQRVAGAWSYVSSWMRVTTFAMVPCEITRLKCGSVVLCHSASVDFWGRLGQLGATPRRRQRVGLPLKPLLRKAHVACDRQHSPAAGVRWRRLSLLPGLVFIDVTKIRALSPVFPPCLPQGFRHFSLSRLHPSPALFFPLCVLRLHPAHSRSRTARFVTSGCLLLAPALSGPRRYRSSAKSETRLRKAL